MTAKQARLMTWAAFFLAVLACGYGTVRAQGFGAARCTRTAQAAFSACRHSAAEEYWIAIGNCENVPSIGERRMCRQGASAVLMSAIEECDEQLDARGDICDALGEGPYDPEINPEDFVSGVDNPYFPLTPGTTLFYQNSEEDITIEVTHETKEILGVTCVEVRDTVALRKNGQVVEDTQDWYAQDKDGNVWYFGEVARGFDEAGKLVTLDGSWEAGRDNAKPGIIMKADPQVSDVYRQEFFLGEAEDFAEVLSIDGSAEVPAASCNNACIVTADSLPFEPDHIEHKYYALGIGLILEVNSDTGERVELVDITRKEDGIHLKEAKLNIEHNATAEDTGFQGFIDSEGRKRLQITGPNGTVLAFEGRGELGTLGLTELFFETVEPENADVPIEDMLALLPEGEYTIHGPSVEGVPTIGTALLTHDIPAGPVLLSPAKGATVPPNNLVMSWNQVAQTITGESVTIVSYQLIVEKDEAPHQHAIGKRGMSIYVPPSVTSVTVPNEFLEPGTHYLWEVLAIEVSGNQTLSSSDFTISRGGAAFTFRGVRP